MHVRDDGRCPRASKPAQFHKHRTHDHAVPTRIAGMQHQSSIISADIGMYSRNRREDTGHSQQVIL